MYAKNGNMAGGALLKRLHDTMEKRANSDLQSRGVTFTQIQVLKVLNMREDGEATLKEIEGYFDVAQSTAAGVVVRLEKKNLVTSYIDEGDKRIKHIRITPQGREVCHSVKQVMDENERRLFSGLTEEEKEQFLSLLKKIYDTME